jgi:hypothetical protein
MRLFRCRSTAVRVSAGHVDGSRSVVVNRAAPLLALGLEVADRWWGVEPHRVKQFSQPACVVAWCCDLVRPGVVLPSERCRVTW